MAVQATGDVVPNRPLHWRGRAHHRQKGPSRKGRRALASGAQRACSRRPEAVQNVHRTWYPPHGALHWLRSCPRCTYEGRGNWEPRGGGESCCGGGCEQWRGEARAAFLSVMSSRPTATTAPSASTSFFTRRASARRAAFYGSHGLLRCTWWRDNISEGRYGGLYIMATSPAPMTAISSLQHARFH